MRSTTNLKIDELSDEIGIRIHGSLQDFMSADSIHCDDPEEKARLELKYPLELLN